MATTSQTVTAENLLSATVRYSNKDDASRVYNITANVNIQNAQVSSFDSGEVRKIDSNDNDGMGYVATFSSYSPRSLNINIADADESEGKSIMSAIYAFMMDVKSTVNTTPIIA